MSQTVINENNENKKINEENKPQNTIENQQLEKKSFINIIDFELNPLEENKINSPRSIEAIAKLGYIFEDLIYNDFNKFKQIHYEIIPLELEMQQKRYNLYEDIRKNKIAEIKDLYIKLCNNENKKETNTMLNYYSKKDYDNTVIKNNLISFEKIKAKNELYLINMANYEIEREIDQQFAKEKLRIKDEKREIFIKELEQKRNIEKMKKLQKEKEKKQKEEEEIKIQQKKDKERYEEEIKKIKDEQEKEKLKLIQNEKKKREEEEKRIKIQEKVNKMLEDSNIKLYQKQKELEIKEQERQKKIEEYKMKKKIEKKKK
jgi:hypothetical protein